MDFVPDVSTEAEVRVETRKTTANHMKLHWVLLGWSDPDQALRVSAGTSRKHAFGGLKPSGDNCQGYEAFPVM